MTPRRSGRLKSISTRNSKDGTLKTQNILSNSGKNQKRNGIAKSKHHVNSTLDLDNSVAPSKKKRLGKKKLLKEILRDLPSLYLRNPPVRLVLPMENFTNEQKQSVISMGFESVLSLRILRLPPTLGYWLVENYDAETNTLKIGSNSILITRETVRDIYGFPMGDTPIKALKRASTQSTVIQELHGFFDDMKPGRLHLSQVIREMTKAKDGGRKFQLNFLVCMVTILLGGTDLGTVDQTFLPDIDSECDIKQLDWCTYTLERLKESKLEWKKDNNECQFNGPLTLLVVLYVSSTILVGENVERSYPLMNCWTTVLLKSREKHEVLKGFGKLKIADDVRSFDDTPDDEELRDALLKKLKKNKHSKEAMQKANEVVHEEIIREGNGGCDVSTHTEEMYAGPRYSQNQPKDQRECPQQNEDLVILDIETKCEEILRRTELGRVELDSCLTRGLCRFPQNEVLLSLMKRRDKIFGLSTTESGVRVTPYVSLDSSAHSDKPTGVQNNKETGAPEQQEQFASNTCREELCHWSTSESGGVNYVSVDSSENSIIPMDVQDNQQCKSPQMHNPRVVGDAYIQLMKEIDKIFGLSIRESPGIMIPYISKDASAHLDISPHQRTVTSERDTVESSGKIKMLSEEGGVPEVEDDFSAFKIKMVSEEDDSKTSSVVEEEKDQGKIRRNESSDYDDDCHSESSKKRKCRVIK